MCKVIIILFSKYMSLILNIRYLENNYSKKVYYENINTKT